MTQVKVGTQLHDHNKIDATCKGIYGEMIESADVETLCAELGMTIEDVWTLRKQFNDEDADNTYVIHQRQRH